MRAGAFGHFSPVFAWLYTRHGLSCMVCPSLGNHLLVDGMLVLDGAACHSAPVLPLARCCIPGHGVLSTPSLVMRSFPAGGGAASAEAGSSNDDLSMVEGIWSPCASLCAHVRRGGAASQPMLGSEGPGLWARYGSRRGFWLVGCLLRFSGSSDGLSLLAMGWLRRCFSPPAWRLL